MNEILQALSAPQNALLTALLILVLLYWATVIVLGIGIELLDGAFSFMDIGGHDVDPTTGLDTHLDHGHIESPIFTTVLRFFNFGEVPVTIILSVYILVAWAGNFWLFSWYKAYPGPVQALIVFGILVGALFVTKPITAPFKSVFSSKEEATHERTNLIGCDCILTMPVNETQSGQAEAKTSTNRFLVVSVRAAPGQGPIPKGARAVIASVDPNAGGYLVRLPGSDTNTSVGGNTK
jgi:hypothetical protein